LSGGRKKGPTRTGERIIKGQEKKRVKSWGEGNKKKNGARGQKDAPLGTSRLKKTTKREAGGGGRGDKKWEKKFGEKPQVKQKKMTLDNPRKQESAKPGRHARNRIQKKWVGVQTLKIGVPLGPRKTPPKTAPPVGVEPGEGYHRKKRRINRQIGKKDGPCAGAKQK